MKTILKYIAGFTVAAIAISIISCTKSFYTDANVNPNSPGSVPPGTMLTNIEVSLGFTQGGDGARFSSLFTQQTLGSTRQAQLYYSYVFGPNDPEFLWDNMYTSVMENDYTLMNSAQSAGYNTYYGITNLLMAYSLQATVDVWGSIPYTQALQGATNIQPAYDGDQAIYNSIIQLINTGMTALKSPSPGTMRPGSDDVIYGGNKSSWIAFGYALQARVYYHQCKLSSSFLTNAINAADSALSNGFSNAQVSFGASSTNNNPTYQFNQQRGDIVYAGTTLTDTLKGWSDPRVGVDSNTGSTTSYYGNQASPVEFITVEEVNFIIAECMLRNGAPSATAQPFYTAAITASFTKLGLSSSLAAYLAGSQGTLPLTNAAALHKVQVQKWAALYLNPEAWSSYRLSFSKTQTSGAPVLIPASGSEIPRRMIYSTTEVTLNPHCPKSATLFQPQVFWDTYPN
jgi:hypothetical protein